MPAAFPAVNPSRRTAVAVGVVGVACGLPLLDAYVGSGSYLASPFMVLVAAVAGYVVGAWTSARIASVCAAGGAVLLTVANQHTDDTYAFLDDLVFFAVVVGGPALAGAAVVARAWQVRQLSALQDELRAQRRREVSAARMEEQTRLQQEVHRRLGERVGAIALRAEGAQRSGSPEQRRIALSEVETAGREALDELRNAVGWLREPVEEQAVVEAAEEQVAPPAVSRTDLLVALGVGVAIAVEALVREAPHGPRWANVVMALLAAAPLVLRRRAPLVSVTLCLAAGTVMSHWFTPLPATVTGLLLLVVTGYAVGAWTRGRWWLPGTVLTGAGLLAMFLATPPSARDTDGLLPTLVCSGLAVAAGRVTAGWQVRADRMATAVAELERGREVQLRMAVAREREAVASSLHDSVAHSMTVVCLQAGAGGRVGDPAVVAEALETIAETARSGLVELRTGLGSLDGDSPHLDRPVVDALARRTGVRVELEAADGVLARGLTAALGVRVLREALVNVARHAPGETARVVVAPDGPGLHLEVTNHGSEAAPYDAGTGTGLSGLAAALDDAAGSLSWGPLPDGGFRVRAHLPVDDRDRALAAP